MIEKVVIIASLSLAIFLKPGNGYFRDVYDISYYEAVKWVRICFSHEMEPVVIPEWSSGFLTF